MDTKNLKRPVIPAICLLLLLFIVTVSNVRNLISTAFTINAYLQVDIFEQKPILILYVVINVLTYLVSPLVSALSLLLCIMLLLKKRNGLLVASVGIYNILPLYSILLFFISIVMLGIDILTNYYHYLNIFDVLVLVFPRVSVLGKILSWAASVVLFAVSISAWDRIFKNPKAEKVRRILKMFFWVPAVLYLLAVPFFWAPTIADIIQLLRYSSSSLLITCFWLIVDIIRLAMCQLLTFVFFLTFGLWLRNPYKKGMEPAENNEAINDTETESAEKSANEEAASAE